MYLLHISHIASGIHDKSEDKIQEMYFVYITY
jgi:hypothetical protein